MGTPTAKPPAKKADIHVLKCLDPECRALMAYEVNGKNELYLDLSWSAERDGDTLYLPCPKCGGRNVLEPCVTDKGKATHRVVRFEP